MDTTKQSFFVKNKKFYTTLITLTLPIALQNVITFAVNLADNIMVGKLGEAPLSGVYAASQISTLLFMLVIGIAGAMIILSTQYIGKNDYDAVKKIIGIALKFAIGSSLVIWAVVYFFPGAILSLFTDDPVISDYGKSYLTILSFSFIFFAITNVLLAAMRCVKTVMLGTVVSVVSLIINVALNWVFIFGNLSAPAMGVQGAAIATLIARIVECLIVVIYVFFIDKKLKIKLYELVRSSKVLLYDFLKYGLPAITGDVFWGVNLAVQGAIVGRLGESTISAVSIANTAFQIISVFSYGVKDAASVMVGVAIGEGNVPKVRQYSRTLQVIFLGMGIFSGSLMLLLKEPVCMIYSSSMDASTLDIVRQLLMVLSVTLVGTSYQMATLKGIVSAGGSTNFVLFNDLIFIPIFVIPSAAIAAFVFYAPAWIVFACLKCDQILKCSVAFVKVNYGKWMRNLTRNNV